MKQLVRRKRQFVLLIRVCYMFRPI